MSLKVAVCQTTSIDKVSANLAQIKGLLESVPQDVGLICLPENCLYMRLKEGESIEALSLDHPAVKELGAIAQERQTRIHMGSLAVLNGTLRNASVLVEPSGKARISYEKMHLFDIELDGQKPMRESDVFTHGNQPQIFEIDQWRVGQTICYDLRFAELFSAYAAQCVDVILVPAAFLVATGKAHWEVLLRARAIESQAYVVAAAQAGVHRNQVGQQRETYGNSMIIDPWGQVVARGSSHQPEVLIHELDMNVIEKVRRQIPMRHHRRLLQVKR